jgi:hypothetical protein
VASDDWRLRIELPEHEHAPRLLERLGLVRTDADELTHELADSRLAVTHDDGTVFVYAASALELERASAVIQQELTELGVRPGRLVTEHWLLDEERWDDDPEGPDYDEEILAAGYAPWEVRVRCADHRAAHTLADQLESEGYGVVRRWRYVIAGCASRKDADALAERLHGDVEPGGDLVWESLHGHPFAVVSPI